MVMNFLSKKLMFASAAVILFFSSEILAGQKNVFGNDLKECTKGTGYYRDGLCNTGADDQGTHVMCAIVTQDFLDYTKSVGNDLSTPSSYFKGLKPGDHWCLCGFRFEQARKVGHAPKVLLESTHEKAVNFTPLEILKTFAQK